MEVGETSYKTMKNNFTARYCHSFSILEGFPLSSTKNSKSISVHVFNFMNLLRKSFFFLIYNHGIPWIILDKFLADIFSQLCYKSVILIKTYHQDSMTEFSMSALVSVNNTKSVCKHLFGCGKANIEPLERKIFTT